jgi:hypothetical protein
MHVAYSENKSENRCTSNGFRRKGWKHAHELHTNRAGVKNVRVVANVEVCATEYRHRKGIKAYLRCTQKQTRRKPIYYLPVDKQMVVTAYQLRVDTSGNERCKSAAYRHSGGGNVFISCVQAQGERKAYLSYVWT